jgi:hypothetical protein
MTSSTGITGFTGLDATGCAVCRGRNRARSSTPCPTISSAASSAGTRSERSVPVAAWFVMPRERPSTMVAVASSRPPGDPDLYRRSPTASTLLASRSPAGSTG